MKKKDGLMSEEVGGASDTAERAQAVAPDAESDVGGVDVRQTIERINSENAKPDKKKRNASEAALLVLQIIFFPVTLVILCGKKIFKRFKVGITVKTTVIFTAVFGILIAAYAIFTIASIANLASRGEQITQAYLNKFIITTVALVVVFVVCGAVLGGISSHYMINPVRKISKRVKEISGEDISARLDPVDSQDELMELTDRINGMLDLLQQAFERQENFVSDASHELKTSLSVFAGYANLLRRWGKDDPKILDESVEAISRESENMKRIVDQLLWLAKLGNFSLNNTVFNLYEIVSDIVDGYKMTNTKHDISLSGDASVTLDTDKNLITEAVRTLVDNAIKYTPPQSGVIKINIARGADSVVISIADNGVGISEADRAHIFERFYRCDKVRGREQGSCGLGLTICKSIVEMMGGRISVESEPGKGSKFIIELF